MGFKPRIMAMSPIKRKGGYRISKTRGLYKIKAIGHAPFLPRLSERCVDPSSGALWNEGLVI